MSEVQLFVQRGATTSFTAQMTVAYEAWGAWDMRDVPPPAACMMETMQPALDGLADHVRSSWTPKKHAHFPSAVKERAVQLLLIGYELIDTSGLDESFKDVWIGHVMPHALAHVRVERPITVIEDMQEGDGDGEENEDVVQ